MPKPPRIYDLALVLSLTADEETRAKVLADVESTIESAGGTIELKQEWGHRPMTFEIRHQAEGEYHLYQFTGPTSLLDALSHNLHIQDSVLRFRIIKVVPGTPPAPESAPPVLATVAGGGQVAQTDELDG